MRVHFIAIGGSAMHNLAIALHKKGFRVTGSDDEIFEPSRGRLAVHGILPERWGWDPNKITSDIEAVILGMHARKDNPELARALEMGIKVYSYPEYLYTQTNNKTRVVIGGSHGKTTVTSMVMHALKETQTKFDFMVGAQLEGFDTMVNLTDDAPLAVFEGDEYLSSPIDLRPKFLWYKPQIAVLTGVAWDHINVFPTFENYLTQFSLFASSIKDGGTLIYFENDPHLADIALQHKERLTLVPYQATAHTVEKGTTYAIAQGKKYPLKVFGPHNLQNLQAALLVCKSLGMAEDTFLTAVQSFTGASRRLQSLYHGTTSDVFFDFAHSPSKLKATTEAVKLQFPDRQLVACMELHTFSSLNKAFLPQYNGAMAQADKAYVYFSPEVMKHKQLEAFSEKEVADAFGHQNIEVFTDSGRIFELLRGTNWKNKNLLIMTSGNFDGVDIKGYVKESFGE